MKDMRYYSTKLVYEDMDSLYKKLYPVITRNPLCNNDELMLLYHALQDAMVVYEKWLEEMEESKEC